MDFRSFVASSFLFDSPRLGEEYLGWIKVGLPILQV
jgi:hypothetical protein